MESLHIEYLVVGSPDERERRIHLYISTYDTQRKNLST